MSLNFYGRLNNIFYDHWLLSNYGFWISFWCLQIWGDGEEKASLSFPIWYPTSLPNISLWWAGWKYSKWVYLESFNRSFYYRSHFHSLLDTNQVFH